MRPSRQFHPSETYDARDSSGVMPIAVHLMSISSVKAPVKTASTTALHCGVSARSGSTSAIVTQLAAISSKTIRSNHTFSMVAIAWARSGCVASSKKKARPSYFLPATLVNGLPLATTEHAEPDDLFSADVVAARCGDADNVLAGPASGVLLVDIEVTRSAGLRSMGARVRAAARPRVGSWPGALERRF